MHVFSLITRWPLEFKWPIIIAFNELGPEIAFLFFKDIYRGSHLSLSLPELNTCSDKAQIGVAVKPLPLDALT